ncbi:permease prefix domain 1-containing protein [Neobacillus sp. 19]
MNEDEKEEVREEIFSHLKEHAKELMIKGYTEEEAVLQAMKSFGNERKLNWEMKKAAFPFYKPVRFIWNVFFVTAALCLISFSAMEFYHPEFDNALPLESVMMGFFLVVFIAGAAEVLYEAINQQFKSKWLANPWLFFFIPSLIFGGVQSMSFLKNPEQYPDGLWLDLFAIPIGAFAYLVSRQLFTRIFVRNRRDFIGKID